MINRRDFLALSALFTGALVTLPYIRIKEQMELSDVWAKLANQARLTPEELDFLKMQGRETQLRNAFISGNTSPSGGLIVPMPFFPVFNEVLTVDKASFSIPNITQGYNHLIVVCSGRSTDAVTGPVTLNAQFNGDTGANYTVQYLSAFDATVAAGSGYTSTDMSIGLLVGDSSPSGEAGSSFAVITNYRSPFYKQIIRFNGYGGASDTAVYLNAGAWRNTAKIESMLLFADSGNIKAGTSISIYGIL